MHRVEQSNCFEAFVQVRNVLVKQTVTKALIDTFPRERRSQPRFAMRCQSHLFRRWSTQNIDCVTQNISSKGFYCFSPVPFDVGESLRCLLQLPPQDLAEAVDPFVLECFVTVVRLEVGKRRFGIACKIDDYRTASEGAVAGILSRMTG